MVAKLVFQAGGPRFKPWYDFYSERSWIHSKNCTTCSGLLKTALNNVLLPTLLNVVNNVVQNCYNAVFNSPEQLLWFCLCNWGERLSFRFLSVFLEEDIVVSLPPINMAMDCLENLIGQSGLENKFQNNIVFAVEKCQAKLQMLYINKFGHYSIL